MSATPAGAHVIEHRGVEERDDGTYVVTSTAGNGAERGSVWTLRQVTTPDDDEYTQLEVGPDAADITEPATLRWLAQALITSARGLEVRETAGFDSTISDVSALLGGWEDLDDFWDVAGAVAGAHRILTLRLRYYARLLLDALDGDETAADICDLDSMRGPSRDADIADVFRLDSARLRETLTQWANLELDAALTRDARRQLEP